MSKKVAFITGASRGIGAEAAVALARRGYRVAITARTLAEGEKHDHVGSDAPLPGSLEATAAAVEAAGGEALCLKADILDEQSMVDAALAALARFGRVDLLFNNAVYQGQGNQESVLDVTRQQLDCIYQGNVFTPLALVRTLLPGMLERGEGTLLNMVSYTAFNNPPAPADRGGWGFAYPSSKAAFARMAGALRVEHAGSGVRIFNIEPGTVVTEVMKAVGMTEEVMARFKPCTPQAIAAVVAWLAENEPLAEWQPEETLAAPAIAKQLDLLRVPSLLGD
ncbi:SDR family NAD(P)-dependent oxidoreductase [Pseudohalioglobus sediminis]|uniref:SDR family NAD(P)-dependent oxidoreductase n=1 Tax=Pseudohalioglobus sediminis TaxID=2606449 RepID=A0A5B0X320_9GAMM|nr:SDR family NAD(P)-dependent oxidoreductase [Pseudohalioglobus sediminis]KAA1193095.1 SDR family NAD(P)-dependent oxidoreductase [Pseudohalioglobus sediminis]